MSSLRNIEADLNAAIQATQRLLRDLRSLQSISVTEYARHALGLPLDHAPHPTAESNGKPSQ